MGESIQSSVANAFRHHANREHSRRLRTPDLFSVAPIVYSRVFRCRILDGFSVPAGQRVALVSKKTSVQVWCETHKIGEVLSEDAPDLINACALDPRAADIVLACVEDEVSFDGCCTVMVGTPEHHVAHR